MSAFETAPSTPGQPPGTAVRKLAPDLARGVMLLLIAMAYAGVYAGAGFGTDVSGQPLLDRLAALVTTLLLDNRAFPMFAILFGYGMAWMVARQKSRGATDQQVRHLLRRRGGFLLLFGFVHAFLVFPGEILSSYGLAALVTGWLLLRSNRALKRAGVLLAACYAVSVPLAMLAMSVGATMDGADAVGAIPGYLTAQDWIERLVGLPLAPLFIAFAYPLLLLVVLGYQAGRAGLLDDPAAHRRFLTRLAAIGVTVSVLCAVPSALTAVGVLSPNAVLGGLFMGLQVLTGILGGAGYAALFALWSVRLQRSHPLTRAIAAMGQRSLTFYILNSVLVAVVLHPDLIGLGTVVGGAGALLAAALAWSISLLLAAWLENTGRPGPLDQLMRRCVYRNRQRRPAADIARRV